MQRSKIKQRAKVNMIDRTKSYTNQTTLFNINHVQMHLYRVDFNEYGPVKTNTAL